jgi:hypothetical protein
MDVYDDIKASEIQIDKEFRDLIPAITTEEREQLEANIVAHGGARDPLVAWLAADDLYILLDGHNRLEICTRLGLPFSVAQARFDTREQAADWIDRNQLGRRNLTVAGRKILLGRVYNRAKKSEHDGGQGKKRSGGQNARHSETTAQRIAREHGVDEKTVRRSAKVQQAAAALGIEQEITSGAIRATEASVVAAAAELPANPSPEQVKQAREKVAKKKQPAKRKQAEKAIAGQSNKHSPADDLRAAVVKRWGTMSAWDKHWARADMRDVRRLFIEVIREEQKQFDK